MPMSTDEILKVIESEKTSQSFEDTNDNKATEAANAAPIENDKALDADTESEVKDLEKVDEKEEVTEQAQNTPKKVYTHQEKSDHAFAKLKQKNKAQREKYENRIKELEEELNKYKGLSLNDFKGNQQDYIDYVVQQKEQQKELESIKADKNTLDNSEIEAYNDYIVKKSFNTQDEIDSYNELLTKNGTMFKDALDEFDPEHVVLSYLDTLDNYPVLLQKLMTDENALRTVFKTRDPLERKMALIKLNKEMNTPKVAKKSLPVIGKQVNASNNSNSGTRDDTYWANYIKNHPRGSV